MYIYLNVIVSLSDCEWVQKEESEETERFASANFKEKLQDLQLVHVSFKTDSELEVSRVLVYDTIISDVDVMMLTAIAEWSTFRVQLPIASCTESIESDISIELNPFCMSITSNCTCTCVS